MVIPAAATAELATKFLLEILLLSLIFKWLLFEHLFGINHSLTGECLRYKKYGGI
jgi:hypothetical protein